jgi:uncharacterized delta-60 repeat protein
MRYFVLLITAVCCSITLLAQDLEVDPGFIPSIYERATITQAAINSEGSIYFTGTYDLVSGELRSGMSKLTPNGYIDEVFSIGSGFDGNIFRLVSLSTDQVLVIGDFTTYNGVVTGPMVQINGDGSIDEGFMKATEIESSIQNPITNVIELANGKLLLYGRFTHYNGFATNSIVILNQDGSVDNNFSYQGDDVLSVSQAALQSSGKIIVAVGRDNSQSGLILRLNADGTKDETFNDFDTDLNTVHKIMAQSTDKLLVLADSPEDDQSSVDLIRLNADGTSDDSFNLGTGILGFFDDFQINKEDQILIGSSRWGGEAGTIDGNPIGLISRLEPDGAFNTSFVSRLPNESSKVVQGKNGNIFIYGEFSKIKRPETDPFDNTKIHYTQGIARLTSTGTIETNFRAEISRIPETILVEGSIIIPVFSDSYDNSAYLKSLSDQWDYLRRQPAVPFMVEEIKVVRTFSHNLNGGGLVAYGGGPRADTGQNLFFLSSGGREAWFDYSFGTSYNDNWVNDLTMNAASEIYAVGSFSGLQGQTDGLAGIVKFDTGGARINSFTSPFSADSVNITDIELQEDGKLIIAGVYAPVGETNLSNGITRLNADGSFDETFDRSVNFSGGTVEKVEIVEDGYIVAGDFTMLNSSESRKGIAKINSDGSLNLEFNGDDSWVGKKIYQVKVVGDAIYIGGDFTEYQGQEVSGLIKLDLDGKLDDSFKLPNTLTALVRDFEVLPGDELEVYMAGKFFDSGLGRKLSAVKLAVGLDIGHEENPIELTVDQVGYDAVKLSWEESSTNAESFFIERSKNDQEHFEGIKTIGASKNAYSDDQLYETGITYYYRVRAAKGNFRSEYSNIVEVEVPQRPLAPPTDLSIFFYSAYRVKLNWEESSFEETGFSIERSKNDQQNFMEIGSVGANKKAYEDDQLDETGTTYYYRVRAVKGDYRSEYSNIIMVEVPQRPLVPPANLIISSYSPDQVKLNWEESNFEETGFSIERSKNDQQNFVEIGSVGANTTDFEDLTAEEQSTYYYRVKADKGDFSSEYSNIVALTKPKAPSNLTGIIISGNQIDLSWTDNSDNEDGFLFLRSVNEGEWESYATLPANQTSFSDTDVAVGQILRYYVLATYDEFTSVASNLLEIDISIITSIEEGVPSQDSRFDFSYDPVSNDLVFKLNASSDKIRGYRLLTSGGVIQMSQEDLGTQELNLSLSGNALGIYILHVTSDRDKYVMKFIKN